MADRHVWQRMACHAIAYLQLCRVSNLPTVVTNALTGLVLCGVAVGWLRGVALTVAMGCMYCAGMSLNDVLDVEQDRVVRPDRPIPSGRVTRGQALVLTLSLMASGLFLVGLVGRTGLFAALLLVGAIVGYNLWHRKSAFAVGLMGACRGLIYVVVSVSVVGYVPWKVAIAALVQTFYVIFITLSARRDKEQGVGMTVPMGWLLAGISIVDGVWLGVFVGYWWVLVGAAGAVATLLGQKRVRGD